MCVQFITLICYSDGAVQLSAYPCLIGYFIHLSKITLKEIKVVFYQYFLVLAISLFICVNIFFLEWGLVYCLITVLY